MKSERRQELQQNSLESWLVDSYQNVRSQLAQKLPVPPALRILLVGTLLVLVVFSGVWFFQKSTREQQNAAAWQDLFQVMALPQPGVGDNMVPIDQLDDFILFQEASRTGWFSWLPGLSDNAQVIAWAKVKRGNLHLADGITSAFTEKEIAGQALERACEDYQSALTLVGRAPPAPTELRLEALVGLARANEALMATTAVRDGKEQREKYRQKALEFYKELALDDDGDSALVTIAQRRQEALQRDQTRDNQEESFFRFLATYKPAPPADTALPAGDPLPQIIPVESEPEGDGASDDSPGKEVSPVTEDAAGAPGDGTP